MSDYKAIAESKNFIVLDKYTREWKVAESYQSESDLEHELIQDLVNQGYEFASSIKTPADLLANVRAQLQALNAVQFTDGEWPRFVETYLDKPSDGIVEKTRKVHDDYIHDFVFDDGRIQNIYLLDKKNVTRNKVQVIKQFEQTGTHANRYDVTILVNGLPLVQVELKKRGVAIREAFNQVHRYSKESFNSEQSLFKYLQLFVISNGTDSRYFANNARSETVATKPSYRDAWRLGRRCIIPAEAFYEPDWRSGRAVPTRIARTDGQPMGIAGIWTGWRAPDGTIIRSMSMLTVNADDHPLMRNFHRPEDEKRMVVILDEAEYDAWLDERNGEPHELLRQLDPAKLAASF